MIRHINVCIYCDWKDTPPDYRIYVDTELITEKTFGWASNEVYIKEFLVCDLEPGVHTVRIENCSKTGSFHLEEFCSDGPNDLVHPNYIDPERKKITFVVNQ
jgi:hypothetical protein